MRSGSWIQTTGPNNGHQLRDYSKSSNRSENRPLIYTRRIVSGGGMMWYSKDHYKSFIRIYP